MGCAERTLTLFHTQTPACTQITFLTITPLSGLCHGMVIRPFGGERLRKKTVYLLVYGRERHLSRTEGKFECGDYLVSFSLFVSECAPVCVCVWDSVCASLWVNSAYMTAGIMG